MAQDTNTVTTIESMSITLIIGKGEQFFVKDFAFTGVPPDVRPLPPGKYRFSYQNGRIILEEKDVPTEFTVGEWGVGPGKISMLLTLEK